MIGRRGRPSAVEEAKPKGFDDFELRLGDVMRGERATLAKSLLDVQRELKIKATYIAAIENCDVSAFETPGFIAGYVRSYARYLGMDPEWAYARFCDEAQFSAEQSFMPVPGQNVRPAAAVKRPGPARPVRPAAAGGAPEAGDPIANPRIRFVPHMPGAFSGFQFQPSAIGSLAVLIALIAGVGYGGWRVLQEVQKVQVAPVDQAPAVIASLDPLAGVAQLPPKADNSAALKVPGAQNAGGLYRPKALDVPVMVPRDGPIAAINPDAPVPSDLQIADGALPASGPGSAPAPIAGADAAASAAAGGDAAVAAAIASASGVNGADNSPKVVAAAAPGVQIFAVRPAWVRVTGADGTVLFEKILNAGERYSVPQAEQPARLRAGNSGSVYFEIGGQTYGPASTSTQVVSKLALTSDNLRASFAVADVKRDPALAHFAIASAAAVPTSKAAVINAASAPGK